MARGHVDPSPMHLFLCLELRNNAQGKIKKAQFAVAAPWALRRIFEMGAN